MVFCPDKYHFFKKSSLQALSIGSLLLFSHTFSFASEEPLEVTQSTELSSDFDDQWEEYFVYESDGATSSDASDDGEKKKRRRRVARRTYAIPQHRIADATDSYKAGYIQGLIDLHYYEYEVLVYVEGTDVYLYNLPNNVLVKNSIIAFVEDMPDVCAVYIGEDFPDKELKKNEQFEARPYVNGVWFPENSVLFQPLIANPREITYSVGYRMSDNILGNQIIPISLGDIFPIFRWTDVGPLHAAIQIDIAACVWGVFNMNPDNAPNDEWAELITTDYILSIPLTWAFDRWSFRLRVYHISSHLGDEFMNNNPPVVRLNPSFEALEFMSSCQAADGLRLYFGPGFILNSDQSYPLDRWYLEYGGEWRIETYNSHYHKLYGSPFIAVDVQNWQCAGWRFSTTAQIGYEWSKLHGAGRKVRLFGEYHHGVSEGQFFKDISQYYAIRISWGF
ncbi:MAG: hypothetical protein S4CHLAM102_02000 [Chlamydiia bacterium]|nr:hypothetical protein [Chlamydiia bacterium]